MLKPQDFKGNVMDTLNERIKNALRECPNMEDLRRDEAARKKAELDRYCDGVEGICLSITKKVQKYRSNLNNGAKEGVDLTIDIPEDMLGENGECFLFEHINNVLKQKGLFVVYENGKVKIRMPKN